MKHDRPDRLLSVTELAEMLRISPASIYNGKCGTREIPRLKLGGRVMFSLKSVESWIEAKIRAAEHEILENKIKTRQTIIDFNAYLRRK